ncbi:MAG: GNAT family protein [Alphaproteobacteria bacterium]|nr:GNAT family protein [Alphaproteobacteria bacterium]
MLRVGDVTDWRSWQSIREVSRSFLTPWEPSWSLNALTYSHFGNQLRRQWREWREGKGYAFQICLRMRGNDGPENYALLPVVGGIALSDVVRGISQKGTLGYWIGEPYAGQGYMTEAAGLVCDFAFKELKLHRLEASCLPENEPSSRLLRKLGFNEEGLARSYLKINNKWSDHLLWGKVE